MHMLRERCLLCELSLSTCYYYIWSWCMWLCIMCIDNIMLLWLLIIILTLFTNIQFDRSAYIVWFMLRFKPQEGRRSFTQSVMGYCAWSCQCCVVVSFYAAWWCHSMLRGGGGGVILCCVVVVVSVPGKGGPHVLPPREEIVNMHAHLPHIQYVCTLL